MPRLRKAFDVLILLLVLAGPASYLPWARVLLLPPFLVLVGAYWISILWIFFTSGFSFASRASGGVRVHTIKNQARSPLLSSQHLHLALLIIKSSLHLSHLLITTSCLRILLHPLSQQSHLYLCAWMVFPRPAAKEKFFLKICPPRGKRCVQERYVNRVFLSPHSASNNSINIRFKKNLEAV